MITKGERTELRSIVKQQFRVLRHELFQRRAEMMAAVEEEIAQRFADEDQAWAVAMHRVQEAVLTANREVNNALYEGGFAERGKYERNYVMCERMTKPTQERMRLRVVADSRIEAQMKAAELRLEREEADLLRSLAVDAIESEEARRFLSAIPTVGELVPAARLAELEASLADPDQ